MAWKSRLCCCPSTPTVCLLGLLTCSTLSGQPHLNEEVKLVLRASAPPDAFAPPSAPTTALPCRPAPLPLLAACLLLSSSSRSVVAAAGTTAGLLVPSVALAPLMPVLQLLLLSATADVAACSLLSAAAGDGRSCASVALLLAAASIAGGWGGGVGCGALSSCSPSSVMKLVMIILPGGDMLAASCKSVTPMQMCDHNMRLCDRCLAST